MAMTPGRPHDSTVHPRTRPEAEEIARKMRGESDWFRHDGKNVEEPQAPAHRLSGANAEEIAEKNKGSPDEWFEHNPENAPEPAPKERCPTEESKQIHDKVQGKDEKWFKVEENQDYYSPKGKERNSGVAGTEIKEKHTKTNQNEWFKHEHTQREEPESPQKDPATETTAEQNGRKMKGDGKAPDWYSHDGHGDKDVQAETPRGKGSHRFTAAEAGGYMERNKQGSVASWYTHDHQGEESPRQGFSSPRVTSTDGQANASRQKGDSENWYNHDQKSPSARPDKYRSAEANAMVQKSRGGGMSQVMNQQDNTGYSSPKHAKVKPEGEDNAKKNQQGLMDKYLNQDANKDYNSARPAARVKSGEAQASKEKNQGVMGDCMQGYLPDPEKHSGKRVKPDAAATAQKHSGATMSAMMAGEVPDSGRKVGRGVKPEAEFYANRNQGTLKGLMDNYGQMSMDAPKTKTRSAEAAAIAEKHKGSVGGCFAYGYN